MEIVIKNFLTKKSQSSQGNSGKPCQILSEAMQTLTSCLRKARREHCAIHSKILVSKPERHH